jgi:hypothetical protein
MAATTAATAATHSVGQLHVGVQGGVHSSTWGCEVRVLRKERPCGLLLLLRVSWVGVA